MLADIVEEISLCADLGDLDLRVLPMLRRALDLSHTLVFRFTSEGSPLTLGGSLAPAMSGYDRELFAADPIHPVLRRQRPRRQAHLSNELLAPGVMEHSVSYEGFYQRHDILHLAGLWLTDVPYGTPGMTGLLLTRARAERPFSRGEAQRWEPLLAALRGLQRRSQLALVEQTAWPAVLAAVQHATRPALVLDRRRRSILWAGASAREILDRRGLSAADLCDVLDDGSGSPWLADVRAFGSELCVVTLTAAVSRAAVLRLGEKRGLTRAELRVLELLADGESNREIAARCFVSLATVKTHVRRILAKLGVSNRTQAALLVAAEPL